MVGLIVVILAFLVIFYVFTYIRYRKRRSHMVDAVNEFHRQYIDRKDSQSNDDPEELTPYITRYNSPIDYIELADLMEESQQERNKENKINENSSTVKRKFLF